MGAMQIRFFIERFQEGAPIITQHMLAELAHLVDLAGITHDQVDAMMKARDLDAETSPAFRGVTQ